MAEEKEQSRGKSAVSSVGQQALGAGVRRLVGQALSKAGAAAGSFFGPIGTGIGAAIGWAASNKYVIGLIGGVAVFIFIVIPVIIIVLIFGLGSTEPVAAEEEETLSATKTANPSRIKKNAPPTEVTYKITVENITAESTGGSITVKDIKLSDGFIGLDKTIGDLGPGDTHTETVKHTITDTSEDKIVTNTVTVTGTIPGAPPSGDGLNYYIPYGDNSIVPVNPEGIKAFANSRYPDNNVDKPCPGGVTCWDYVIQQSKASGISPAFAIAIWWEEGGFGGLVDGGRSSAQFGCGYYPGNFMGAFNCFLDFTSKTHPYDSADPMGSFTEWVNYFCGPDQPVICKNNPDFISSLEDVYSRAELAPGKIVYISGGGSPPSGETVTVTATATVIIGNPPLSDPSGWSVSGSITQTPYCSPCGSEACPSHCTLSGWDIARAGIAWDPIYSTHNGIAYWGEDVGGYGIYVVVEGPTYSTMYAHMPQVGGVNHVCVPETGSGPVNQGALLGWVDSTGWSGGHHLHYEIRWTGQGSFFNFTKLTTKEFQDLGYEVNPGSVTADYSGEGC